MDTMTVLQGTEALAKQATATGGAIASIIELAKPMSKHAASAYIESISQDPKLTPIEKSAFIESYKRIMKEYKNKHDITKLALEYMDKNVQPIEPDETWYSYFMDKAKNVCNDDIKVIWGKLLAGELSNPNSVPKVLLNALELMDIETAEVFRQICCFTVSIMPGEEILPIIPWNSNRDYFSGRGISRSELFKLHNLGLILFTSASEQWFLMNGLTFSYSGTTVQVWSDSKALKAQIPIGNITLSIEGYILSCLLEPDAHDDVFEVWKSYFEKYGCVCRYIN